MLGGAWREPASRRSLLRRKREVKAGGLDGRHGFHEAEILTSRSTRDTFVVRPTSRTWPKFRPRPLITGRRLDGGHAWVGKRRHSGRTLDGEPPRGRTDAAHVPTYKHGKRRPPWPLTRLRHKAYLCEALCSAPWPVAIHAARAALFSACLVPSMTGPRRVLVGENAAQHRRNCRSGPAEIRQQPIRRVALTEFWCG